MKRAKMMLLAVAIFGTVGAALAFKAKSFNAPNLFICTTNAAHPSGVCTVSSYATIQGAGTTTTYPKTLAWTKTTTTACTAASQNSTVCGSSSANPTTIFLNP